MRNIFLLGLSGSGKSTVGRLLAQRLGRPLLDVDALVEEECGERIATIFTRHGEDYFRTCESHALAQATRVEGAIIATGGGIVLRAENRRLMRAHGLSVWLQIEPRTALLRLEQQASARSQGFSPEVRPLLAGAHPLAALQTLLATRADWYGEAQFRCVTDAKTPEQVVQEIVAMGLNIDEYVAPIVRHVQVGAGIAGYDAVVDWGGLSRLAEYLKRLNLPPRIFLVTDSNLQRLYAPTVLQQLTEGGFEPHLYAVPAGEASKSQQQLNALYDWLLERHAERREAILAFGGGVVGDLVGFAAASYLRGVPLIQVPTSLLAQVDAAIGGKTGINHPRGKNLIGAFYHPRLVLADPAALLTLPPRECTEGWAEVVKYGIILDAELFAQLEKYREMLRNFQHFQQPPAALLCQVIARCIDLKVAVIEQDEREQGQRAILNYGHTIGHALENAAGYGEFLHGEAVSLGMVVAATLAQRAAMMPEADVERQNALLAALGLPIVYRGSVRAEAILAAMQLDKKVSSKRVRWIMPRRIGEVTITPLPDELVQSVINAFFA